MKAELLQNINPKRKEKLLFYLKRDRCLYLMLIPVVLYYIILRYVPMYGLLMAFEDYSPFKGILGSQWVWFENFRLFMTGPFFLKLIRNTLTINLYDIILGFPMPIILALAFNEIRPGKIKSLSQTISYLPYFISSVIVTGMVLAFLSPNTGIVNTFIKALGFEPIYFMTEPSWFYIVYTTMNIWQGIGFGSIIYMAALAQIDTQLYEAAVMDGAGKWCQMWHITLPGIAPTIIILFILRMGSMLSVGFENIINLYNASIYETADVLGTYTFRVGLQGKIKADYSLGSAIGFFESVVGLLLVYITNTISKKVSGTHL